VPTVLSVTARPAKVTRVEKKIFSVNNAQFPYDESHEVVGHELIFDTVGAKQVPAHAMSDGTLLTLAILTTCWDRTSLGLILLDDIEYGLHPLGQRRFVQTLKELAASQQQQIILTSHSPYIVDELDAKDVWVMATDQEGISHCKRLSDHPDATRLLEVLTTGELEGAVGEDWVLPHKALAEEVNA
jgi:predicted ATPase